MKNRIIRFLNGYTYEDMVSMRSSYEEDSLESVRILKDWRRGMSMKCKDIKCVDKVNSWMQEIINKLPINRQEGSSLYL